MGGRKNKAMKKLLFIAACAAGMIAVADVQSANIVGYNTVTIHPGFNMLSVNFKNVANTEGIGIQELFCGTGDAGTCPFKGYTNGTQADQIQVYVNDGDKADYVNYYLYYNAKQTTNVKNYKWCRATDNAVETAKKFKNGDTLWFYRLGTTPATFNISGEVDLSAVKSFTIQPGFNMIGSFFPAGWAPNDAPYTTDYWKNSGAKGYTNGTQADQIQVYVNDGKTADYVNYYLYYNAKQTTNVKNYKWCKATDNSAVSGNILSIGQGAWYYRLGTTPMTLEIKNQFSK